MAHGVKVISIGLMVEPGRPLVWRGPMLHSAIRQLLTDVEWGVLDYLIVDLPPGTGDVQISLGQLVHLTGGIIVTLPQKVAREDALRGLEMFKMMNVPILGVVENMSYWIGPDGKSGRSLRTRRRPGACRTGRRAVPGRDPDRSECAHRRR